MLSEFEFNSARKLGYKFEELDTEKFEKLTSSVELGNPTIRNMFIGFHLFNLVRVDGYVYKGYNELPISENIPNFSKNWEALILALEQFYKRFQKSWSITQSTPYWYLVIGGYNLKFNNYPNPNEITPVLCRQIMYYSWREAIDKLALESQIPF